MNDELIYKFLCFCFIRFYSRRFNLSHIEQIELLKSCEVKNENKG